MEIFTNLSFLSFQSNLLKWLAKIKLSALLIVYTICFFSPDTAFSKEVTLGNKKVSLSEVTDLQQKHPINGTITDATTGETLVGATIMVKGSKIGVISDLNGKFSINLPSKDAVLTISFVGYIPQELNVTEGNVMNIKMASLVRQIEDVVIVGYGTQKKESVVGAISQVGGGTLVKSGTPNITNAISGMLSGVLTIQQTGQPGSNDSEIVIRGLSSWSGSAPLVLVDGIERDFSDIDADQINTVSVLKDASATAVFGAKGANGVIIVTTKRGALGKPRISVSTSTGANVATSIPDHISSYTTESMFNVALKNEQRYTQLVPASVLAEFKSPSTPLKALQYPDVNWFDVLMKPYAPTSNANINLTGGTDFVKYFCSLSYLNEGDYFKSKGTGFEKTGSNFNRINYRANVDFTLSKTTQLSINLGGDYGVRNQPVNSPWSYMSFSSVALFPANFPDWVLKQVPDLDYPNASGSRLANALGDFYGNPYSLMNSGGFNQYTQSKLYTDLVLTQKLDFLTKGLSFKGSVSLNTYYNSLSLTSAYTSPEYILDYSKIGVDANGDGKVDQNPWFRVGQGNETYTTPLLDINVGGLQSDYYRNLYYEFALNYSRTFGEKHNVTAMALMNRQEQNKGTDFAYYNEAWVGRATYDYSHRYLAELNVGYTGSERFAPGNRFGFFPSGAIGWVISEEPFFKNSVKWMSKLKIRYSDGLVGSDYASTRWLYKSDYFLDSRGYITEDKGANPTAQWEEARKRDLGIETGIFNNLLTVSIDLFDEHRDKMLLTPRSVTMLVGNSFKDLNLGSLKKHGIEFEVAYNKTTNRKLNYFAKALFGFNENRIISKDDLPYAPAYSQDAGKPLGAQKSGVELTGSGYVATIEQIHTVPSPVTPDKLVLGDYQFLDYNADGQITALDMHPINGNLYPPITYSFSSGFSYKGFDFNFMLQGDYGKYVDYFGSYEIEFTRDARSVNIAQLNYWSPNNQDVNHPTLHASGSTTPYLNWGGGESDQYKIRIVDRNWRNANYLRLKEVYVGYTFNTTKRIAGVSNILVYASVSNLLTFTKLIQGDPERTNFSNGYYPIFKSFNLGLKFTF